MFDKKEFAAQEKVVNKKLLLVAIPIVILLVIIGKWQSNSFPLAEQEYFKERNTQYSEEVIKKFEEGGYPRAHRHVTLSDYRQIWLLENTYDLIALGDSVFKKKNSDSIYIKLQNDSIIIIDRLKHLREHYNKLLLRKNESN
jgi:hypothetical protein